MAIIDSQIPNAALTEAPTSPRSRLDAAMKSMSGWSNEDRQIFIASFTTRKSKQRVAHELGLTPQAFQVRKRQILRRFMRAADAVSLA